MIIFHKIIMKAKKIIAIKKIIATEKNIKKMKIKKKRQKQVKKKRMNRLVQINLVLEKVMMNYITEVIYQLMVLLIYYGYQNKGKNTI